MRMRRRKRQLRWSREAKRSVDVCAMRRTLTLAVTPALREGSLAPLRWARSASRAHSSGFIDSTESRTSGSSLCECVKPRRRSSATVSAER